MKDVANRVESYCIGMKRRIKLYKKVVPYLHKLAENELATLPLFDECTDFWFKQTYGNKR